MSSYIPIESITLGSAQSSVTFSSIPTTKNGKTLRDLVLVSDLTSSTDYVGFFMRFNSDANANYSSVFMYGVGSGSGTSSTFSGAGVKLNYDSIRTTTRSIVLASVFDFAQTNKHKSVLMRQDNAGEQAGAVAGRWANTSAITSLTIVLGSGNIASGSTFNLYGIEG